MLSISLPLRSFAQPLPGTLDASFGNGGTVTTDLEAFDSALCTVVQPDGRIIAAGYSGSENSDFSLVRYNANGSLDMTFGNGGIVRTDFFGSYDWINAIALQNDGKIVVAGIVDGYDPSPGDFGVARYNQDGSLDLSFGIGGKATTDFHGERDYPLALSIQPDGKISVAGTTYDSPNNRNLLALAKFDSGGSLDSTFGTGGKVTADFLSQGSGISAVVFQNDGKVVVAGTSQLNGDADFGLARYNGDGTLDTAFGEAGSITTDFGTVNDYAFAVAVTLDGRIVAAGESQPGSGGQVNSTLVRYLPTGTLDTAFGNDGIVVTPIDGYSTLTGVKVQPDGRTVAAGWTDETDGENGDFLVLRFNVDGSLDTDFGSGGVVRTDFFGHPDVVEALTLQGDGNILLFGNARVDGDTTDFALARYVGGPAVIPTATGSDVVVASGNLTLSFANVTSTGSTTIRTIDPATAGDVPGGFALFNSAYEVTTTATFNGSVTTCFSITTVNDESEFLAFRVLHNENGSLVDRTSSHDFPNRKICATTTSFSPFYLARVGDNASYIFDRSRAFKSGSTVPVKIKLLNSYGGNISASNLPLYVRGLRRVGSATAAEVNDPGESNPDYQFRFVGDQYQYNLKTKGLVPGKYVLSFYAGNVSTFFYTMEFELK